ncbi:MAG: FHA domain-containing protein, partial [Bdellovibrionaceae bacterium]|nr:FHA domain-containing protein [Pseudobdellovibrionaceae bacterium]
MGALQQKAEIKIKLAVVKGPHAGQTFQLSKKDITLGRGPENNVVLMNDPQISRVHAQIRVVNNEIEIVNLSQKNAVVVDGASVQKWKLVNNSTFTLGDSEIQIEYDLGQIVVSVGNQKMGEVVAFKGANSGATVAEAVVTP